MRETASKKFSAKTLKGLPLGLALKFGLPVSVQYLVYWFFTQVINVTLLHSRLDGWVAAIGVTAAAYGLRHFHRHLTKPSLVDSLVELAKFNAVMQAAQKAQDAPAETSGLGAYL